MATQDVRGVPTLDGKQLSMYLYQGIASTTGITYFRIGEGGFIFAAGGQQVPRNPDDGSGYSDLSTVEATVDITADPASTELRYFEKALTPGDFADDGDSDLIVTCFMDLTEGNGSPSPENDPKYFEIGLYTASNIMVAYGTFPATSKSDSTTITRLVKITF